MRKRVAVLASGFFLVSAIVACVGGPGPLPNGDDTNPDVERSAGSGTGSKSGSGQGGGAGTGGSTGSGTATPTPTGTTLPPSTPPNNTKSISASEFNRSCSVDSDCVLVYQGQVCNQCQCATSGTGGSIAKTDQSKYNSTLSDRRNDPPCPPETDQACAPCATTFVAACNANKQCSQGLPKKDGG
jgi:hypothetical protein